MRKLRHYSIIVSNEAERNAAIAFYRRASHRPLSQYRHSDGRHVGMSNGTFGTAIKPARLLVNCSSGLYPDEKAITIAAAARILTDTPARRRAWNQTLGKLHQAQLNTLPLVSFSYYHSATRKNKVRHVRVTKADKTYIEGFDTGDGNQFKRFKRGRASIPMFLEFKS